MSWYLDTIFQSRIFIFVIILVSRIFLSLLEDCEKRRVLIYRHEDEKSILFILEGEGGAIPEGVAGIRVDTF